jgi:hypothetical protein
MRTVPRIALNQWGNINKRNKEAKTAITHQKVSIPFIECQLSKYELVKQRHHSKADRKFQAIDE